MTILNMWQNSRVPKYTILLCTTILLGCNRGEWRYVQDLSDHTWTISIDSSAMWENDTLYLPPVHLEKLPVNPPGKGWNTLEDSGHQKTNLPATIEQYFWNNAVDTAWGAGDFSGVSWFTTSIHVPAQLEGKAIFLDFESVRLRAEVYVNQELAGYDCIGNTPFRVEITRCIKYNTKNQIAIRITDPGGTFYWEDYHLDRWGELYIPPSHGFGGITGKIKLVAVDSTYLNDIYIQNTPEINTIRIQTTLTNLHQSVQKGVLTFLVKEPDNHKSGVNIRMEDIELQPGNNMLDTLITITGHREWSLEDPRLYKLETIWKSDQNEEDRQSDRFGLRWFEAREVDGNTSFYLNNKRIFITSAISWGFWPDNGIFPTPELARKQILNLKSLGLNMFNFHRAIGQTVLFDLADELGMLIYEEPGGYRCPHEEIWFWKENDPANSIPVGDAQLAWRWRREKLLRMIKRDRSHPSLVIYNMGNEMLMDPDEQHRKDMLAAHHLDPSRYITFSSHSFHPTFFPEYPNGDCPVDSAPAKLFMQPNDNRFHYSGWWDNHHALGEGTYREGHYNGPEDYNLHSDNTREIVFYGEEGAINAPARLDSIIPLLDRHSINGWDSRFYRNTYENICNYLQAKGFQADGLSPENLITSFADNSYYYHGKMIENCRIGNTVDAYVINGLEDPKRSFYSGILDIYRHVKGNGELISAYMQPLYIAIKPRTKVVGPLDTLLMDIFIVNENMLTGEYDLVLFVKSDQDTLFSRTYKVNVSGGNQFGELLLENVQIPTEDYSASGYLDLHCTLSRDSEEMTRGYEQVYKISTVPELTLSSIYFEGEEGGIRSFLLESGVNLQPFSDTSSEGNLLIAARPLTDARMEELLQWSYSGNKLLILKDAKEWMHFLIKKDPGIFKGIITNDAEWSAGGFFNRSHPIFQGLPTGGIMGWEYQDLTNNYQNRYSLKLEGEQSFVGAFGNEQNQIGTAVGDVKYGKGIILLNTLDLNQVLLEQNSSATICRQILINLLNYH